jgi:hypothetical protein
MVMGFWDTTLSSAIGSFVGVIGAYLIAKWQIEKGLKFSNNGFYFRFNYAQIHINRFNAIVDMILENTQGVERTHARETLSAQYFVDLKKEIELALKTLNKEIEEIDFNNFVEELVTIVQNAPLPFYRDFYALFFGMAFIYNLLLEDCRHIVMDIDVATRIDIPMHSNRSLNYINKKFRKKYRKMSKKLQF